MPNVYISKPHHKQERNSSCIPTCVRIMLEFFGIKVSESELRLKLKTKPFGTHVINILTINDEPYGIHSAIEFWSLEQLKTYLEKFKTPCIVTIWTEFLNHWDSECLHTVVVNGFDDQHIFINDPNFDKKEFYVPFEHFLNSWQINEGLVILSKEETIKNKEKGYCLRQTSRCLINLVQRGYSGKGVAVGGIHNDVDDIIKHALNNGDYNDYIVQEKIPLNLWTEKMPDLDLENRCVKEVQYQTDFRCLFGKEGLYGFLGRFGKVPTNVGSGGGVQPLAVLRSDMSIGEATKRINEAILNMNYGNVLEAVEEQKQMALDDRFTYLLGPIKIALRPQLITIDQIKTLETYTAGIWSSCLTLEKMWLSEELHVIICIEPEELEIVRSQPWRGSPAIFASDGLFSFGAHIT